MALFEPKFERNSDSLGFSQRVPWTDLCLMSLCTDAIIANSSYSWWGAWLGKSDKVIAPKNWFGASCSHKSVDDMVFGDWSWL